MLILGLLINALVQFLLYKLAGLSADACIVGFLVGSIFMAYSSAKVK